MVKVDYKNVYDPAYEEVIPTSSRISIKIGFRAINGHVLYT